MNGLILINKPVGMTSADVVYKLRKILHLKKIGHAGTLDPAVSGVLPIAVGQATKLIDRLHERSKQYQGTGRLGLQTDTGDLSGRVIAKQQVERPVTYDQLATALESLTGAVQQVPPLYSAVKVNGRKLYEYARAGETVEVPARTVNVEEFVLTGEPLFDETSHVEDFSFSVTCSKGTYVRTLVEQVGTELNLPAVMTKLVRTKSAGFDLTQTVTIEDVEQNMANPAQFLLPLDALFTDLVKVELSKGQWQKVHNGAVLQLQDISADEQEIALVFGGKIKAIYKRMAGRTDLYVPGLMLLQND